MPVSFQYPEFLLLAIPLWMAYRRWGRMANPDRGTAILRIITAAVLLFALTGPEWNLGGRGLDVIVVADRSRSLTESHRAGIRELIDILEENRGPGDRIGIVGFGATATVERLPSGNDFFTGFEKDVSDNGSDFNEALLTALNVVNKDRPARILALTDGEANGADPKAAARRARELGVPVDFRAYERTRVGDVAVEDITLPQSVAPREPFQFTVEVFADREVTATVEVLREGEPFASQQVKLATGTNAIPFREVLDEGGFFHYEASVTVDDDPLPENNRGTNVVRVDAGPRVLVLNSDGQPGNMVRALRAAKIPVDIAVAKNHSLTQDDLDPYRAVIVENTPAGELGRQKMERLAQYVEDLGGGLLLTGGERSFGVGGYYRSPLDDVLPVSMEIREEHRKIRVAIAVVLDRSGSMTAPVKGGQTKMDLANLGAAEVVKLLTPQDMVSVIAVDQAPHVIQEMAKVTDRDRMAETVRKIQSEGGGIYVYDGLVAAGEQLMKAEGYQTRHVILFSDAQDSEQPGEYEKLLEEFQQAGVTVSVIGLGTESDSDAELLKDIAQRGAGNIMFTQDAQELPRLFTQDTMSVARSSFIKKNEEQPDGIPAELLSEQARLMGELDLGEFPKADGYNLSYLKPEATAAVVSRDEYKAPWSAFWYRGLGRVSAITLEVDGQYTGRFGRWEHYEDFFITHVRWLLGGNNPNDVFVALERDGQDAVVTVELDPLRTDKAAGRPPVLYVVPPGADREAAQTPDFQWTGPDSLQARFRMDETGTYRTLVHTGPQRFTRGPAVTLPYSPEFNPRHDIETARQLLKDVAELSGGTGRADVLEILADPPRSPRMMPLLPWLLILGLVLLVAEIAGRRLSLWKRSKVNVVESAAGAAAPPNRGWKPKVRWEERGGKRELPSPVQPKKRRPAESTEQIFEKAKERAKRRSGD